MKPRIDHTKFGSITVGGEEFKYDIVIGPSGKVKKRKKKLSKAIYGTSHVISLDEARYVYQDGADRLIVGTGLFGRVELAQDAADFFQEKGCQVDLLRNKKAVGAWNGAEGNVIGLFHVTC